MLNVNIAGGASISLTYIASERIIPGYSHAFLLLLEVTMPFFFSLSKTSLEIVICRYGGGMSSAKAALESDTRVGFLFLSRFFFLNL